MTRCTDDSYCVLAARGLRKQIKQLLEHLDGVRSGDDIECIHRVRVASRRLRAVFGMFRGCWKPKQIKAWKKQIRQMAQELGEARDQDVLIEFLTAKLAEVADGALVPGIARLLNHVEQERRQLQRRVVKAVDALQQSGVLKEMQAAAQRVLKDADEAEAVASETARRRAAKAVRKKLAKLLAEAPGLADPQQQQRHHAMRIAAKRLRYTLELARPLYAGDLDSFGDAVKRLQTLLGDIHDCDVWARRLDEFAGEESAQIRFCFGESQRFDRLLPGIEHIRRDRGEQRGRLFDELAAYWQELSDRGFWDRLASIIEWSPMPEELHAAV